MSGLKEILTAVFSEIRPTYAAADSTPGCDDKPGDAAAEPAVEPEQARVSY
jgi:hypothetical protein